MGSVTEVEKTADGAGSKQELEMIDDCGKKPVVDVVHNDEATRVLAAYTGDPEWSAEEEKKLVRKIDRRLLSLLFVSYGLQFYDKAILGQAAIFGFREDAGLDIGNRYSFAASIFYLGFLVGAVPATLLAQRFPVERVLSTIVFIWGGCLMACAGCFTFRAVYIQRFFLGFLESGVSPIFMLSVGSFYTKKEQALRQGIWYSATGFVAIISPLINYGLGHINSGALKAWQYMFLLAGGLTVIWAFVLFFYFLRTRSVSADSATKEQVYELLMDVKFWLLFAMGFLNMIPNGPGSSFIPIIINGFGFNRLNTMLLNMPYGLSAGIVNILLPYIAYKYKNMRCYIVILGYTVAMIASILLWKLPRAEKGALLLLATYSPSGVVALVLLWGYTKRSVASSGLFIGYTLGNFVAPLLFKAKDSPQFYPGWTAVMSCCCVAIALTVVYRQYCVWENSKRDKAGTAEGFEHAFEDDVTDMKNPQFRYVY
ncbi:unnamed protein product [Parascedosporium putredinis]|uniref:Major facilitator superfamily (MFS) profile domain-containing protein n=1 Tax=Parascedosporium putredinis TaxID=1442378 RepID=A0A9P1H856_9PEZI|nr:unnamed protein product [Parascedosporium putredinis]CAI8000626.1 unnamed protein product [Parascedosporium putredinis]